MAISVLYLGDDSPIHVVVLLLQNVRFFPGSYPVFHLQLSVEGEKDVLLVECKCWTRTIDVPRFLTFLARILDIRSKHAGSREIHAAVVTKKGFQAGIKKLAEYYRIEFYIVTSPTDFAAKYKNRFWIAKGDALRDLADEVETKVIKTDLTPGQN